MGALFQKNCYRFQTMSIVENSQNSHPFIITNHYSNCFTNLDELNHKKQIKRDKSAFKLRDNIHNSQIMCRRMKNENDFKHSNHF